MCVSRLRQLQLRLNRNKSLFEDYNGIIERQLQDSVVERITGVRDSKNCHYLPHHGITREDKETTKLHIVFDGSAKDVKTVYSLNDCLEKGPNRIPHIFDTLVRYRRNSIGLVADIEKAFHQIVIVESDRDMLHFLWFDDINKDKPEIVQFRFCKLVFGLTPSPAILAETIQHHLTRYLLTEPHMADLMADSFYVDDFTSGASTIEEGMEIYQKAKALMKSGGFNLCKWKTNSVHLQNRIDQVEFDPALDQKPEPDTLVKILGLSWDVSRDEFYYDLQEMISFAKSLPPTKCSVLKVSVKLFDPLALLSPFVISTKVLFQRLCIDKIEWDQVLEGEWLKWWNQFCGGF